MQGHIFDIQRFSLHDGPGIRTTVFLKGCPLRCQWCCNPESLEDGRSLFYNPDKCLQCHACAAVCPSGALKVIDNKLEVNRAACTACGLCPEICPSGAIGLYGYEADTREVMDTVLRDRAYYEHSGGGLTLSGGEAMRQPDFSLELLKMAKQEGIHTCMESCGFASEQAYRSVLPLVDLFLFDYKVTGEEDHLELCGQPAAPALKALEFLASQGARIHLRCPMIPGVNDDRMHLEAIQKLASSYPSIEGVELMPYHHYGAHKYKLLGINDPLQGKESASKEELAAWKNTLRELGCKKLIEG